MKKFIAALLPVFLLGACTKDLTTLNNDPKNPATVSSASLFTNAQRTLSNTLTSSNVNLNIFRLIEQQWQETTYTDESNYDLETRQVPTQVWNTLYRDVLRDFQEARTIIPTDVSDADVQKNQLAVIDIMEVYTWYYLVTTFGNVPYSQALNVDNTFPKYDDALTVYTDLFKRLDTDISALNASSASFGGADVIYKGDVAKWKLFGNTLKLKMGMTIADADNAKAKTAVESAVTAGVFTSNADNAIFQYVSGPPNTNPVWVDLVQSGRQDFVANSILIDNMNANNDSRRPYYFTLDASGSYSGGDPGASSNYATFSKPSGPNLVASSIGKVTNADFPGLLLDYSEVEFLLAEAAERGYSVSGTATEHYTKAITASFNYWGAPNVAAYLAQPSIAYATATGNYKQKIGMQKWLALYNRGWDAWIEQRRLDFPALEAPETALTDFPVRFTYPTTEQNVNVVNYNQASQAIGGDAVKTKLFFDKF